MTSDLKYQEFSYSWTLYLLQIFNPSTRSGASRNYCFLPITRSITFCKSKLKKSYKENRFEEILRYLKWHKKLMCVWNWIQRFLGSAAIKASFHRSYSTKTPTHCWNQILLSFDRRTVFAVLSITPTPCDSNVATTQTIENLH